jgi:xylulokinase
MYIGVDVGTTGIKVITFDPEGRIISSSYRSYSLIMNGHGHIECDADVIWNCFKSAVREASRTMKKDYAVSTIGFSSFGEAFVPIDRAGNKLCNSMIGTDVRGKEEALEILGKLDELGLAKISGHAKSGDYSISKLLWLMSNRRDIYDNAWKFLLYEDYLGFMLTGETYIDYSLASRTMIFDITKKIWSPEMANLIGFDLDKLATPVASGTPIGMVRKVVCDDLGLAGQVTVVAGGHDVPCALMGSGAMKKGRAIDIIGTTECIAAIIGNHTLSSEVTVSQNLVCEPFMLDNFYNTLAFSWNAGSILNWYFDKLLANEHRSGDIGEYFRKYDDYCKDEPVNTLLLPHFSGTGTIFANERSYGAMVGLSLEVSDKNIYQAILESVTYEMKMNLECLENNGIKIAELSAVGGGAKSPVWLQIKANIYDRAISTLECSEAGALGVAMAGAVCKGRYKSFEEATEAMVRVKNTFYPNQSITQKYERRFAIYSMLFDSLKSINNSLRELD